MDINQRLSELRQICRDRMAVNTGADIDRELNEISQLEAELRRMVKPQ